MSSERQCYSCGCIPGEAPFPPRKTKGRRLLCVPCQAIEDRDPAPRGRAPITRASYRAALPHRQKSPQGDLVDLIVLAP